MVINANGIAETSIRSNAGAAAWAKNASDEALHMDVAKVSKPNGLNIKVAGNSFIVNKNTIAPPANMPCFTKGIVNVFKT